MTAHCPTCGAYEQAILRRQPDEEVPAGLEPCPDYAMSPEFRDHLVEMMRREVLGTVAIPLKT